MLVSLVQCWTRRANEANLGELIKTYKDCLHCSSSHDMGKRSNDTEASESLDRVMLSYRASSSNLGTNSRTIPPTKSLVCRPQEIRSAMEQTGRRANGQTDTDSHESCLLCYVISEG